MSEFRILLKRHLGSICPLSDRQVRMLEHHYELLRRWNSRMNLTSLQQPEQIVIRHYCESLALGAALPKGSLRIADLGSGAGFPGFPIAVLRPDCSITLVESNGKKAVFLRESTRQQRNIVIAEQRISTVENHFDWVVSRGVRWKSFLGVALSFADHVALLVGQRDSGELRLRTEFTWSPPVVLPWGEKRVILMGAVSRGTSSLTSLESRST